MNHSELSHMAGAVDDSTIKFNIVVVIVIIIIIIALWLIGQIVCLQLSEELCRLIGYQLPFFRFYPDFFLQLFAI